MNKIDVFNTAIVINDYDFGDCPTLENYFKIRVPVTKVYSTYKYFGIYYDEDSFILSSFGRRSVTYSYTDVLTRTVELDVFNGEEYSPLIPPVLEEKNRKRSV
jgi:hypothetical protein